MRAVYKWVQSIQSQVDDTPFSTKMAEESPELAQLIGEYELKLDAVLYDLRNALRAKSVEVQP